MNQDRRWPRHRQSSILAYEVVCVNADCVIYMADNIYSWTPDAAARKWNRRAKPKK